MLIQPAGRTWDYFHEVLLHWGGAIVILGMIAILGVAYLIIGRIPISEGRSGRKVAPLQGHREIFALADGGFVCRAWPDRPEYHLRQGAAVAGDRPGRVLQRLAVGEVHAQLHQLRLRGRVSS